MIRWRDIGLVWSCMILITATPALAQGRMKPARGQKCYVVTERPKGEPVAIDSVKAAARESMERAVAAMLEGRQVGRGYLVLRLDEITFQRRFEAIDVALEQALADAISGRMAEYVNTIGESAFIRLPMNEPPIVSDTLTPPFEDCPPSLRNRAPVADRIARLREQFRKPATRFVDQRLEALLWIFVDERGRVVDVRVKESSGVPEYDKATRDIAFQMEFHPLLRNGAPGQAWVTMPIILSLPGETIRR